MGLCRGFSYEADWYEAFEKAGCNVSGNLEERDAEGFVILHGIGPNSGDLYQLEHLRWLETKKVKKLALVVNEHKFSSRKAVFDQCGITVGSQSDDPKIWTDWIFVPCALNPEMYREITPRSQRPHKMGFRGSRYKSGKHNVDEERNRIVDYFAKDHPEVKIGSQFLIRDREELARFLNTIKATPGSEGGNVGLKIPVHRHVEAIGCKVIQVLHPGRYCGVIQPSDYISLERDFSNIDEVLMKLEDEDFCESMTSLVRERMCDTNTVDMGVKRILEWLMK